MKGRDASSGHIEGAYLVPKGQVEWRMRELAPFKHSEVVTVSRTGTSSRDVAVLLVRKALRGTVYRLGVAIGGLEAGVAAGKVIEALGRSTGHRDALPEGRV